MGFYNTINVTPRTELAPGGNIMEIKRQERKNNKNLRMKMLLSLIGSAFILFPSVNAMDPDHAQDYSAEQPGAQSPEEELYLVITEECLSCGRKLEYRMPVAQLSAPLIILDGCPCNDEKSNEGGAAVSSPVPHAYQEPVSYISPVAPKVESALNALEGETEIPAGPADRPVFGPELPPDDCSPAPTAKRRLKKCIVSQFCLDCNETHEFAAIEIGDQVYRSSCRDRS